MLKGFKTYLGIGIAALPQIAPALGLTVSGDDAALISQAVDSIITTIGLILAAYGRFVTKPKEVT